jgi:hypothetical protein
MVVVVSYTFNLYSMNKRATKLLLTMIFLLNFIDPDFPPTFAISRENLPKTTAALVPLIELEETSHVQQPIIPIPNHSTTHQPVVDNQSLQQLRVTNVSESTSSSSSTTSSSPTTTLKMDQQHPSLYHVDKVPADNIVKQPVVEAAVVLPPLTTPIEQVQAQRISTKVVVSQPVSYYLQKRVYSFHFSFFKILKKILKLIFLETITHPSYPANKN